MAKQLAPKFTYLTDTGSAQFPRRLAAIEAACQVFFPRHTFEVVDFKQARWRIGNESSPDSDALICQIPGAPQKIISAFGTAENLKRLLANLDGASKPGSKDGRRPP